MKKFSFFVFILLLIALGLYIYYNQYSVPKKEAPLPKKPETTESTKPSEDIGTFKLASWNIRIFSNSRNDNELRQICDNIIDYDFVAVIELRDEDVLKRAETMLAGMGRDYDYQISDEVGRGVKERYAFLYDKSKVDVVTPGKIYSDKKSFMREPYYATFRAGKFDFTIIATHIIWGDRIPDRQKEIQKMAEVYEQIQNEDPSEQDVILVGDFNREPDDEKAFSGLRKIPSMTNLFNLPQKTVIFDSNLYDNIWFQANYVKEYNGNKGIVRFDETDFGKTKKDKERASLAVSDHRPVWAEFATNVDDD